MNSLTHSIIEAEARLHRTVFPSADWAIFAKSITWFKIKKDFNFIEREHFRKCWEAS